MRQLTGSVTVIRGMLNVLEVCQLTEMCDGYEG